MGSNLNIAITGAGGAGVITAGEVLLCSWARAGGRGFLRKAYGPQIRGGEAAALLRLSSSQRYTAASDFDVLCALDWQNFDRFEDEIRLQQDSQVFCPEGEPPDAVRAATARLTRLDLAALGREAHPDGRANMVAVGLLGALLDLPPTLLADTAVAQLHGLPASYVDAARACVLLGMARAAELGHLPAALPKQPGGTTWLLSGNQAAAFGAIDAGVRFVAAYPITPASDVLEALAAALPEVGGHLVQAEDELAAINMALGAAFGGVPAFTATSGPGLALMSEAIGLAVASETPVCVLDVMRGGPSTGIPTRTEQSDLALALHGQHGDAPHIVLAALDVADCVFTTALGVQLAQALQTAVILLSDQFLGASTAIVEAPRRLGEKARAVAVAAPDLDAPLQRYRDTPSGVSPLAYPGDRGGRFTADGLEHDERGTPSARASDHRRQLDKRRRKLDSCLEGEDWGRVTGSGAVALVAFGSLSAAIEDAAERLSEADVPVRTVALRLLRPLPAAALEAALEGCSAVVVVEQNHEGQLLGWLRSGLPGDARLTGCAEPGPVPLTGAAIADRVRTQLADRRLRV